MVTDCIACADSSLLQVTPIVDLVVRQQSPPFVASGTSFMEDNFSMDGGGGMVQVVMQAMGSDGERLMKLCSLACCSPPAVQPGS